MTKRTQDGLLIDTERIYTEAAQIFLDEYQPGTKFTWELKSKLMGRTAQEVTRFARIRDLLLNMLPVLPLQSARLFLEGTNIDMPADEYIAKTTATQTRLFHTTEVLPGVEVGLSISYNRDSPSLRMQLYHEAPHTASTRSWCPNCRRHVQHAI